MKLQVSIFETLASYYTPTCSIPLIMTDSQMPEINVDFKGSQLGTFCQKAFRVYCYPEFKHEKNANREGKYVFNLKSIK